jgi:uncharacterized protein YceK
MKRFTLALALTATLGGCATVDRSYSQAVCMEKGATTSECIMARQSDAQNSNAKTTNAATGAVTGCVVTGPFCLLLVGPAIGALIGAGMTQ